MRGTQQGFRTVAKAQAEELLDAIATAESVILSSIERECDALRAGRMLAAKALHTRLSDAARLYLNATRAARASLMTIEHLVPGAGRMLEERRRSFAAMLRVELAALVTERARIAGAWQQRKAHAAPPPFATALPPADASTTLIAARFAPNPRQPERPRRFRPRRHLASG